MTENMKKFVEEAEQDASLSERLSAVKTAEELAALAEEKGFALTEEDLLSLAPPTGELADEALDDVAGGGLGLVPLIWRGGSTTITKLPYTGGATFTKLGGAKTGFTGQTTSQKTQQGWTHI